MKSDLHFADRIIAVNPTSALEIQTPEPGVGMDGALRARQVRCPAFSVVSTMTFGIRNPTQPLPQVDTDVYA
ncbi:MAG TPA: glycogen/starch synthase [Burkholderiales bacterium]|nr:glycogen/starch synthase [Burkholderiales bacterium]